MDLGLAGRRVLVTGATRGIGLAISRGLAAEGALVSLCARDGTEAERVAASLGPGCRGAEVDVVAPGALEAWVAGEDDSFGVVACAGGGGDAEGAFALNAGHALRLVQAWADGGPPAGGAALVIASISGWKPGSGVTYAMAKAAEITLAAQLGRDLAPRGLRVNALSPGSVLFDGGGWAAMRSQDPERFERFVAEELPAGRLGRVEEIAAMACVLMSPVAAAWVNGANVCVDGGQDRPGARRAPSR